MNLEGKIVLITGASSGIGKACALAFAKEKCQLALTGRNQKALEQVKEECVKLGSKPDVVMIIPADLKIDSDVRRIVDETISHFKRIDILVNNAGIGIKPESVQDINMDDYDEMFRVNTRAPFLLTKLALKYIIEAKGNIIFMSSVCGIRAFAKKSLYNMSKAALDQFMKTLSLEVGPKGVRVNSVNPAFIITDFHSKKGYDEQQCERIIEHCKKIYPLGKVAEAFEVADVVVFLASAKSNFITGQTISVDGGRSVMC